MCVAQFQDCCNSTSQKCSVVSHPGVHVYLLTAAMINGYNQPGQQKQDFQQVISYYNINSYHINSEEAGRPAESLENAEVE